MILDALDKQLLKRLSTGINSYEELARACGVTRNTVYRRIASLENRGIIRNTIRCTINIQKLDIVPICIGFKVPQNKLDETINLLTTHNRIRLLWRSYGDHNVDLVAFAQKGEEGRTIHSIKLMLENFEVTNLDVSVGFVWEKSEFNSIEDQEISSLTPMVMKQENERFQCCAE